MTSRTAAPRYARALFDVAVKEQLGAYPPLNATRLLRAIEVLERIGTPEACRMLGKLAKEATEANVAQEASASLERISKAGRHGP